MKMGAYTRWIYVIGRYRKALQSNPLKSYEDTQLLIAKLILGR